jgi:hypothetical protein
MSVEVSVNNGAGGSESYVLYGNGALGCMLELDAKRVVTEVSLLTVRKASTRCVKKIQEVAERTNAVLMAEVVE